MFVSLDLVCVLDLKCRVSFAVTFKDSHTSCFRVLKHMMRFHHLSSKKRQMKACVLLPSGLFLGWMLLRVVESLAPDRPRGSVFGMDSRGRRIYGKFKENPQDG